jgi:hypothetical protein
LQAHLAATIFLLVSSRLLGDVIRSRVMLDEVHHQAISPKEKTRYVAVAG